MKKRILVAVLAIALLCTTFAGVSLMAADPVTQLSDTEVTEVYVPEACYAFTDAGARELTFVTSEAVPFADNIDGGETFSFKVNAPSAATYSVYLVYAWGYSDPGPSYGFSVNGGTQQTLTNTKRTPAEGEAPAWRNWTATDMIDLALNAGENTIVLTVNGAVNLSAIGFCKADLLSTSYPYFENDPSAAIDPIGVSNDGTNNVAASHIASKEPIAKLEFTCVTWNSNPGGDLDVSIYAWNDTYEKTLEGTAVATHTFAGVMDNSQNYWDFGANPLPAGNYLIVLKGATTSTLPVGIWTKNVEFAGSTFYYNGVKQDGRKLQITAHYANKVLAPYADLKETVTSMNYYDPAAALTPVSLVKDKDYAIQVSVGAPISAFTIPNVPSWNDSVGDLAISVFKWSANYAVTVAGEPVAKKEFLAIPDASQLSWTFDSALPAGEYLIVLSNTTTERDQANEIGLYCTTEGNAFAYATNYIDGVAIDQAAHCILTFAEPIVPGSYQAPSAPVDLKSTIEVEDKDLAIENGVESSMTWLVQEDVAASGGKMQGIAPGYSYIYKNVAKADQIAVYSCGCFNLTATFSYSTDGGVTWTECGSGELVANGVWSGAYVETVIDLTSTIPAGAMLKLDSDADNNANPPRGANIDKLVLISNADTGDSMFVAMLVMMAMVAVALPVLRKREAL